MKNVSAIIASPNFLLHRTGPYHPERPERVVAIIKALDEAKLLNDKTLIAPRMCEDKELLYCHTQKYIELVKKESELCRGAIDNGTVFLSTGDVSVCSDSFDTARCAAGGVLTAVDLVMQGSFQNAFAVVRPPGHHACSNKGMGFCLFNNVAIGARYVQQRYNLKRILIVDWDVHHGNGTQEIFENDPSVFYFSTHQAGIYPGTGLKEDIGLGDAQGTKLNCPILPGPHSRIQLFEAFEKKLTHAMKQFQPEFVFISCGFDAHKDDPLGGFELTDKDFYDLTVQVLDIAHTYSNGRLVSVLEGGYNLAAIARSSVQHLLALNKIKN